jgi:uncharacterized protein (AIM24 family)
MIEGTVAQTARLSLGKGDTVWAAKGSLIAYSSGVEWQVRVPGGLGAAVKRMFAGEGAALAQVRANADGQQLILGANAAGHVERWELDGEGPVLTTRGAFLAAWGDDLDISISAARRVGAALFGGAGLVLQRISGSGTVLIHGRGDFGKIRLDKGEDVLVSTGNLAAFSAGLDYDVRAVGTVRKTLFGNEGFFMTRLVGPGVAYLQTLKRRPSSPRGG